MILIKVFGVALIILSTTVYGIFLANKLNFRLRDITWYCSALQSISQRISYTGQELASILSGIAGSDFYYEIEPPLKITLKKTALTKEDEELIKEFFSEVGMADSASEKNRCALYIKELSVKREHLQKETYEKGKLYRLLGFFCGLAVAIIII